MYRVHIVHGTLCYYLRMLSINESLTSIYNVKKKEEWDTLWLKARQRWQVGLTGHWSWDHLITSLTECCSYLKWLYCLIHTHGHMYEFLGHTLSFEMFHKILTSNSPVQPHLLHVKIYVHGYMWIKGELCFACTIYVCFSQLCSN